MYPFDIQSQSLGDALTLYEFDAYTGYDRNGNPKLIPGLTHKITLNKEEIAELLYENSIPSSLGDWRYYSTFSFNGISKIRFETYLAIENQKVFLDDFFISLKEIADSIGSDHLNFRIFRFDGSQQAGTSGRVSYVRRSTNIEENYFTIDFNLDLKDSPLNRINMIRLYSCILGGNAIRLSTSNDFTYSNVIAEFTKMGTRKFQDNSFKTLIDNTLSQFYLSTNTPYSYITSGGNVHLSIPYSDPYAFFDAFVIESPSKQYEMLKFVDIEKLNKIIEVVEPNNKYWFKFYSEMKKRTPDKLLAINAFMDALIEYRFDGNVDSYGHVYSIHNSFFQKGVLRLDIK